MELIVVVVALVIVILSYHEVLPVLLTVVLVVDI